MKNLSIRALFLSLFSVASFYLGCIGPDPIIPENYATYPLQLKVIEQPDGSFRLTWNAIKSVDFIEYQVIKNTGDTVPFIADSAINKLGQINRNLELAKRIENADSTTFVDSFSLPTRKTFFRVFAVLKNRNLGSKNVEVSVKTDAIEANIIASDLLYIPEDKKIIIGDQTTASIGIYDIQTGISVVNSFNTTFTPNLEMTYGRFNSVTELYVPNGFSIAIRNLSGVFLGSFTNSKFINMDAVLYEKTTNNFLTISSLPTEVNSFARPLNNNFNTLNPTSTARFTTIRPQQFYVFRQAPNAREAIALSTTGGNNHVVWFKYDADCKNVTQIGFLNTTTINITKRPFAIAPDNQGFITSGRGLIINRGLALADSLKLPESDIRYADMVYSSNAIQLYALRNTAERKTKFVDIYTYPGFKFERSVAFKSAPTRVFQDGNELILIGPSPNNPRLTMIEKVRL